MFTSRFFRTLKILSSAFALAITATVGVAENHSTFLVVQVGFADIRAELNHGEPVLPYAEEMGGELLAADQEGMSHEGPCESVWTILMRFPDEVSMHSWHESEEARSLSAAFEPISGGGNSFLLAAPERCAAG